MRDRFGGHNVMSTATCVFGDKTDLTTFGYSGCVWVVQVNDDLIPGHCEARQSPEKKKTFCPCGDWHGPNGDEISNHHFRVSAK